MKTFFETLAVSFSMYSRIPMPHIEWNGKNMRYSMAGFPLVGVVVAAVLWGVLLLFRLLAFSPVFFAAAAAAIPILITGGIHADGYCDTCDALASHGDRETRRRILKDPHVGAFGVIYTGVLLLLQFGAWHQIYEKPGLLAAALAAFVLSRVFAALAIVRFPKASASGLAATFSGFGAKGPVTAVLAVTAAAATLAAGLGSGWAGLAVPAAALLLFLGLHRMAARQFGGVTGDLAGFYVSVFETCALVLAAVLGAVI